MGIVERIKEKCNENNTNIATLERNLNIGNGVIRRWNDRKPLAEQVYNVAICLNTSVEWILTGKEAAELTPEEQQLVDLYRSADERGRRRIRQTAELEAQEQKIINFKDWIKK